MAGRALTLFGADAKRNVFKGKGARAKPGRSAGYKERILGSALGRTSSLIAQTIASARSARAPPGSLTSTPASPNADRAVPGQIGVLNRRSLTTPRHGPR